MISLILSNDTIVLEPPYKITPSILDKITSIAEKMGVIKANYLTKQSPKLRKQNRIKTIHSSLSIEGNTLTIEQVTALLEEKRVIGPQKDVAEVLNAIAVYDQINELNPYAEKDFLKAHQQLLHGLIAHPGFYRKQGVGIVKGNELEHLAPPFENVPFLMKDLFNYLKESEDIDLLKSCVFHYEMQFIHPFIDGNGRMGRLWQTLILMQTYPVFEFIPFETLISQHQDKYYQALSHSDKLGESTPFIEFMLNLIDLSLEDLLDYNNRTLSQEDRLNYFKDLIQSEFTRLDYMNVFKDISTATASRDLKKGIELGFFQKSGEKNKTVYQLFK